jgi:hypothetical protein
MAPSIHLFCSGTCTGPRCRHSLFSRASFQSPTAGRRHVPCRDRIRLKKRTEACSLGHWASRDILALSIRSKSEAVTDTCVAEERSCRARQAWQRPCCACRNRAAYCSREPLRERPFIVRYSRVSVPYCAKCFGLDERASFGLTSDTVRSGQAGRPDARQGPCGDCDMLRLRQAVANASVISVAERPQHRKGHTTTTQKRPFLCCAVKEASLFVCVYSANCSTRYCMGWCVT